MQLVPWLYRSAYNLIFSSRPSNNKHFHTHLQDHLRRVISIFYDNTSQNGDFNALLNSLYSQSFVSISIKCNPHRVWCNELTNLSVIIALGNVIIGSWSWTGNHCVYFYALFWINWTADSWKTCVSWTSRVLRPIWIHLDWLFQAVNWCVDSQWFFQLLLLEFSIYECLLGDHGIKFSSWSLPYCQLSMHKHHPLTSMHL